MPTVAPITKNEAILAASPAYLRKHGTPNTPSDLKRHSLLFLDFHRELRFRKSKLPLSDLESRRGIFCSDGRILGSLAEEGEGICVRPRWDILTSLSSGRLVEIELGDTLNDTTAVYLMYPKTALLPVRTRVVIDALVEHFHLPDKKR